MRKSYFFCGIGGSGMNPLAVMLSMKGHVISGSDRGRDQGKTPEKFRSLETQGIKLFPQDGSGLKAGIDALVVSSAVEETIPDVKRARELGIPVRKRAEVLADLYSDYKTTISVAGTSGKSTVTGMIGTLLEQAGYNPSVMNGGVIRNFMKNGNGSLRLGKGDIFVSETDESDGSIALFSPAVAVLNNIALDHKSIEELESLFSDYVAKATKAAVLNFDDRRVKALAAKAKAPVYSYGLNDGRFMAQDIKLKVDGVAFTVLDTASNETASVHLNVPGEHNVSNALAAIAAAKAVGASLEDSAKALAGFKGIHRRLEVVGTKNQITVIDDFAHNPDKISASLKTLKEFPGRLIVIFQPHGFGPLKLMGREIAAAFEDHFGSHDMLLMPEVYYSGGAADRSVTSKNIIDSLKVKAFWFETREKILPFIKSESKPDDRIVIMGARDDTLTVFAKDILESV